jgi:hypothetical protein
MIHDAMPRRNGQQAAVPLPPGADAHRAASSWLICRASTMLCALPIEQVVEIMRALPRFAGLEGEDNALQPAPYAEVRA